jgi:hypothetical protein
MYVLCNKNFKNYEIYDGKLWISFANTIHGLRRIMCQDANSYPALAAELQIRATLDCHSWRGEVDLLISECVGKGVSNLALVYIIFLLKVGTKVCCLMLLITKMSIYVLLVLCNYRRWPLQGVSKHTNCGPNNLPSGGQHENLVS